LRRIVEDMMRKSSAERIGTAAEVIQRLRPWTPRTPVPMPRTAVAASDRRAVGSARRRRAAAIHPPPMRRRAAVARLPATRAGPPRSSHRGPSIPGPAARWQRTRRSLPGARGSGRTSPRPRPPSAGRPAAWPRLPASRRWWASASGA
jgi:hypothetical protein